MRTVTITVEGRVQGVGFRYALQDAATAAGATGWVRNRRDGSVEAQVTGADAAVEAVIAWAHRGPASARVDRVTVAETEADASPTDFEIRATV
ncbi:MAG: acylphosphatase [Actinobacteria bacterium]|nr:acylphosphatase [Actinomycetota bacterium]